MQKWACPLYIMYIHDMYTCRYCAILIILAETSLYSMYIIMIMYHVLVYDDTPLCQSRYTTAYKRYIMYRYIMYMALCQS